MKREKDKEREFQKKRVLRETSPIEWDAIPIPSSMDESILQINRLS
jgi:hypothetical protein